MALHFPDAPPSTGRKENKVWNKLCDTEGKPLSFLTLEAVIAFVSGTGQYVSKSLGIGSAVTTLNVHCGNASSSMMVCGMLRVVDSIRTISMCKLMGFPRF